jgi:hypothetical protein
MGLVRSCLHEGTHFIESNLEAALGSLVGGFTASQPAADYE